MKKTQGDGGLTIKYAALQGNYWMLFGSVFTFIAVFLLSRGFSAGGVGVLMALGNITGQSCSRGSPLWRIRVRNIR